MCKSIKIVITIRPKEPCNLHLLSLYVSPNPPTSLLFNPKLNYLILYLTTSYTRCIWSTVGLHLSKEQSLQVSITTNPVPCQSTPLVIHCLTCAAYVNQVSWPSSWNCQITNFFFMGHSWICFSCSWICCFSLHFRFKSVCGVGRWQSKWKRWVLIWICTRIQCLGKDHPKA